MRNFIYTFLTACLLLLSTSSSANSVAADKNPLSQQLERIKQQTGIGAVAYALVENNKIVATGGIGKYGHNNARPVTETSLFRVGSITKTFTSLAVMRLVEQGKLQLDEAIKTYASDIPLHNPWPETPVTLAMLLEHTAGLQDLTREEFDYLLPLNLQAALNIKPEARQLRWPPGYHYGYSNLGAGYVGRVIEIVIKEDYDDWFEREIIATLGMQDSRLRWTKELDQNLVTGYDTDLTTKIPYWHTLFRPFGGLNTTAKDMAKFLLLFTGERDTNKNTVSAHAIKRMETPETSLAAKAGLKTGYGLGIRNTYFNGHKIYGHGGDADGYLAEFAYSKESQRAYFVVINAFRHDLLEDFTAPLNNWLIEQLPAKEEATQPVADNPLSGKQQLALAGEYREATQRFPFHNNSPGEILHINNDGNDLFRCISTTTDKCIKILPVTEALFRLEGETHASIAFVKAADGNLYLQTSFDSYKKSDGH
ncbi:MAG: serine hydrolase domain-containing protein [Gammaproteobacteria bacterium]|nr:serine hydrolase domain-containing protein [Gammaproteobacteria bacterium]